MGRDVKPDQKLFPAYYDAEIQSAIRYEPILFFQEILSQNLPVLNLLDSNFTILTNKLSNFYGLGLKGLTQQPKRAELPENSHRGGILNMAAVLAVAVAVPFLIRDNDVPQQAAVQHMSPVPTAEQIAAELTKAFDKHCTPVTA